MNNLLTFHSDQALKSIFKETIQIIQKKQFTKNMAPPAMRTRCCWEIVFNLRQEEGRWDAVLCWTHKWASLQSLICWEEHGPGPQQTQTAGKLSIAAQKSSRESIASSS